MFFKSGFPKNSFPKNGFLPRSVFQNRYSAKSIVFPQIGPRIFPNRFFPIRGLTSTGHALMPTSCHVTSWRDTARCLMPYHVMSWHAMTRDDMTWWRDMMTWQDDMTWWHAWWFIAFFVHSSFTFTLFYVPFNSFKFPFCFRVIPLEFSNKCPTNVAVSLLNSFLKT